MARSRRNFSKPYIAAGAVILVLLAVLAYALVSHKNISTIPSTSPSNKSTDSSSSAPAVSSPSSDKSISSTTPPKGEAPAVPYGTFVSNHHPAAGPTQEASVCNTTPGASCYIEFTYGNDVKKLDPHITDANGSAFWNWNTSQAGLSSGSWKITAVATLNGQTSTANDQLNLEVQ